MDAQLIFITCVVAVAVVGIAYLIGDGRGYDRGKRIGSAEGENAEFTRWIERAIAARDAGTPWAGVEIPEKGDAL